MKASNTRKNNVFTIMRKEFARFFGDKRLVITTIILPGLLIYVLYSFMGTGMSSMFKPSEGKPSRIYAVNMPESVRNSPLMSNTEITDTDKLDHEAISSLLRDKNAELYAEFPADFDKTVEDYKNGNRVSDVMNIAIYYTSTETDSTAAYEKLYGCLNAIETSVANVFDINAGSDIYDVATKEDTTGMLFASLLPLLLITFVFSGCMAVAPESIAGEKERGTIAALLVTPVKRSEIAIGKIIALSCIALLSGISSFAGTVLSLPKLISSDAADIGISANVYKLSDYFTLLAVLLSTVLLMISLISIISTFAKSVKEATTFVTPLMIVVLLLGVTSMFGGKTSGSAITFLIPIYNSVQCMTAVFSFSGSLAFTLTTVLSNIAYTCVAVFVLKKMFDNENIMFGR